MSDLNAVLLPNHYPGHVGFRLEPRFAFALIVDGEQNHPNGRPLMPVKGTRCGVIVRVPRRRETARHG